MIARIWHGYTKPENADTYEAMLKPEVLPGISRVKGYRGSYFLRREHGSEVEFITILLWESLDGRASLPARIMRLRWCRRSGARCCRILTSAPATMR